MNSFTDRMCIFVCLLRMVRTCTRLANYFCVCVCLQNVTGCKAPNQSYFAISQECIVMQKNEAV